MGGGGAGGEGGGGGARAEFSIKMTMVIHFWR